MTNRRQPFIINLLQMLSTHTGPIACLVNYVAQSYSMFAISAQKCIKAKVRFEAMVIDILLSFFKATAFYNLIRFPCLCFWLQGGKLIKVQK